MASTAATLAASASVVGTTHVAAAPLTITAGTVLTATTGTGTQGYVCSQVRVTSSASAGIVSARASNVGAFSLRNENKHTVLTEKPKSFWYNKIWQFRVVNRVIEKATYRLIGFPVFFRNIGSTKSSLILNLQVG